MRFESPKCVKMPVRPGLYPAPRCGSLQRSPSPLAGSRERKMSGEGKGERKVGERRGKEGKK